MAVVKLSIGFAEATGVVLYTHLILVILFSRRHFIENIGDLGHSAAIVTYVLSWRSQTTCGDIGSRTAGRESAYIMASLHRSFLIFLRLLPSSRTYQRTAV